MLVRELIELLSKENSETEVFLKVPGSVYAPAYHTTNIKLETGFVVRNEEKPHEFHSRHAGNGIFVDTRAARTVMRDGKEFIATEAPTVFPAIALETFRKYS